MIIGIFGKPRSGKTTYTASIARKNYVKLQRSINSGRVFKGYPVIYCTDPSIQHTITINYSDLGKWKPTKGSLIILEEAGVGLNNRNFKSLTNDAAYLFATCGHNNVDIIWSSQTVDVDKKLKDRTHFIYLCEKRGLFSILHLVKFSVDVDNETHTLDDFYFKPQGLIQLLGDFLFRRTKIIYRPRWYKYFDSFIDDHIYSMPAPDTLPCSFINEAIKTLKKPVFFGSIQT